MNVVVVSGGVPPKRGRGTAHYRTNNHGASGAEPLSFPVSVRATMGYGVTMGPDAQLSRLAAGRTIQNRSFSCRTWKLS
eukprot:7385611-Prymnesium_polylepis.1